MTLPFLYNKKHNEVWPMKEAHINMCDDAIEKQLAVMVAGSPYEWIKNGATGDDVVIIASPEWAVRLEKVGTFCKLKVQLKDAMDR